jgi:hypothetical protein
MRVAAEVYKTMPVLPDDSPETQYVRELGLRLVETIPEQYSWPFEFHVIPQKEINAFALPGGKMFINLGTLLAAKSEAELAGVMGHEMAHVYMQHSAKQASKSQTTGLLAGIAAAVLGETIGDKAGGMVGELGRLGIQVGAQGLMMKYSRNDESQADTVGTIILYKAGYNPQGMADFFKTMGASGGKGSPTFFSSHPDPSNRQQAVQKQIAGWPAVDYIGQSEAFDVVKQNATQVKVYTAEEIAKHAKSGRWATMNRQGGARTTASGAPASSPRRPGDAASSPAPVPQVPAVSLDSVLPGPRLVSADLGSMKIKHPENWPVTMPEQKGQFVRIAPEAGVTPTGVGYGVLLSATASASGQRMGIDEMTRLLIEKIREGNQLEQIDDPAPITVAGLEGRSTLLESPSQFPDAEGRPQRERDWLVTVPRRDGSLVFMIFIAPVGDYAQFEPTYEAMVKSVQLE